MNSLTLNHSLTPESLQEINAELEAILTADNLEEALLLSKVDERDRQILSHLETLDDEQKKQFAQLELKVNQSLLKTISKLHKHSLNELSGLLKGQKAVKKYK